eukprot:Ihof_evm5s77 gene=Ihof_evmTU5s77
MHNIMPAMLLFTKKSPYMLSTACLHQLTISTSLSARHTTVPILSPTLLSSPLEITKIASSVT